MLLAELLREIAELARAARDERETPPVVVSGGTNKLMLFFMRLVSRKTMTGMMGGFAPKSEETPRLIAPTREVGSR